MRRYGDKQKQIEVKRRLRVKYEGWRLTVRFCVSSRWKMSVWSTAGIANQYHQFQPLCFSSQLPVSRTSTSRRRRVRTNTTAVRRFVNILRVPHVASPACLLKCCAVFVRVCFLAALSRETQEDAGEDGGPAGQKRASEEAAQGSGTESIFKAAAAQELTGLLPLTPIRPPLINDSS